MCSSDLSQAVVWVDPAHTDSATDTSSLKAMLTSGAAANKVLSANYTRVFVSAYSATNFGWLGSYPRSVFTTEQRANEIAEIRDFVAYILKTYGKTGKSFVLKTWEGDWELMGNYDINSVVEKDQVDAIVAWHQARREGMRQGIEAARAAGAVNPNFSYSIEFNLPSRAFTMRKYQLDSGEFKEEPFLNVLSDVIPAVSPDLVTYSSYQTINAHPASEDSLDGNVLSKYWGVRADFQKLLPRVKHPLVISEYLFESGDIVKDGRDMQQTLLAIADSGIDTVRSTVTFALFSHFEIGRAHV